MTPTSNCTHVTADCPIIDTTYGYRPNLAANTLLLIIFAICTLAQVYLGLRYRLRAFLAVVSISCGLEALGYGGRLIMNRNPWDNSGFELQIICIILAPSFLAAGIYLTLKHLILQLGPEVSRLPPKWYPRIFITCDAISILTQAAGGGLAATHILNLVNTGNAVIIAGIAFQVFTMFICWLLAVDFAIRLHKTRPGAFGENGPRFTFYLVASSIAFFTIFVRCVYRLPEMSHGWGSPLQRNEVEFLVLDGVMIAIAAILMTVAHPGIFFPAISPKSHSRTESPSSGEDDEKLEAGQLPEK